MNKQRIRRFLANLLAFLSTCLSSAWLFTPVEQTATSKAPSEVTISVHTPSRFHRLGPLPLGDFWRQLQFINEHEGWFADSENLWHTSDGGKTWRLVASLDQESRNIDHFQFTTSHLGWMIQSQELYRTKNGGVTWDHIPTPMSEGAGSLYSFHFEANGEVGWIAGGIYYPVKSGNCMNNAAGLLPGYTPACLNGAVFRTDDGGISWQQQPTSKHPGRFMSIMFVDSNHGWVAGDADVQYTTDGGRTWHDDRFARGCGDFSDLQDTYTTMITFVDRSNGFLLFSFGMIAKSEDGGKTWCGLPDLPESDSCTDCYLGIQRELRRVLFRDVNYGLALDDQGFMYESTDAGVSWHLLDKSITFESIKFINDTNAWAISIENDLVRVSLGR
jgi:photosystem II stability/assembly factor-like uncharacterized protein